MGRTIKYPHQWLFEKGWTYYEIIHNNDYMNTICITKKSTCCTCHHHPPPILTFFDCLCISSPWTHPHLAGSTGLTPCGTRFPQRLCRFSSGKETPKHVTRTAGRVKNWVIYSSNLAYHFFHDYFFSQSLTYIYPIRSHHVSCIFAEV